MTHVRFGDIERLVKEWNDKEQVGKDFPNAIPALTVNTEGENRKLFLRAAREMSIEPDELHNWFEEDLCGPLGAPSPNVSPLRIADMLSTDGHPCRARSDQQCGKRADRRGAGA